MDDYELEEILSTQSIVYTSNPGKKEIKRLEQYYKVTVIDIHTIKIEYR